MGRLKEPDFMKEIHAIRLNLSKLSNKELLNELRKSKKINN